LSSPIGHSKPENIFIKDDQYKLGDFGLVSKIENHDDVEEGDSRYMSMELLSGELDDLTKVSRNLENIESILKSRTNMQSSNRKPRST